MSYLDVRLFTETKQEHDAYLRDSYLLVSSYGAVYATLRDRGQSLFIVDAVAYKNYFYDLSGDPAEYAQPAHGGNAR